MAHSSRIREHCARHLDLGEEVIEAGRVFVRRGVKTLSVMPPGSAATPLSDWDEVEIDLATAMAIVLTDRRLLVFERGAFNQPGEFLGAIARDLITSIEVGRKRLIRPITIRFVDGTTLELQGVKADQFENLRI